jgi:cytochrome bd ubiquinol oxidase subunit II
LPLGADGDFTRPLGLGDLLNPYSVLTGLFAVSAFAMHGAIYLYLKTEGELQVRIKGWMWRTFFLFLAAYLVLSAWTLIALPDSTANFARHPWLWMVSILNVLAIANVPRAIHHGRPFDAFLSSAAAIAAFTFLFGAALFPNLIVSSEDVAYSLTVSRAASSEKTLEIMRVVAALGMPFVLAYTATVYWVFRGKVKITPTSY